MSIKRRLALLAVPVFLAAALVGLWFVRAPHLSVSLYDLIGREAERIPAFLREASSGEVAIIVSSTAPEKAEHVAETFRQLPGATANDLPSGALAFMRANRAGLVTAADAKLLETPEGRTKLAKRAVRKLYTSPVPPLLGYSDDPFALTDAFLLSLSQAPSRLVTNGVTRILVKLNVNPSETDSLEKSIALYERFKALADAVSSDDVEVRLAGVPIHAARSAARSQTEINVLTVFSLAFIALLSFIVFHSVRWIGLLVSSLLVSAAAGGLALVALFRDLHVMTFVMGTTILGLVIDYSFHWLLSSPADKPAVRKNLLISFMTTEISLVPLMLASIPVLQQAAVFLGVGLAAALAYVVACYPQEGTSAASAQDTRQIPLMPILRRAGGVAVLLLLLALFFAPPRFSTSFTSLYTPPPELLESEKQRAAFGEFNFSQIPPLSERQAVAQNVQRLYAEQGPKMAEVLACEALVPPADPKTDSFIQPQMLMQRILSAWTGEALVRLIVSIAVLLAVLLVLCRARAIRILLPSLIAILCVAAVLALTKGEINLFHILAAFLLLGMGVDYAVFLQSGRHAALRPALCSLFTSLAGFGALAFVSFPVVQSFGQVLGLGLPIAFLAACWTSDVPLNPRPSSAEKAASPLGLELLYAFYCLFGLRALHFAGAAVGTCVWLTSKKVRLASPSLKKMLYFTRSLADKLVVMAEGRRLPRVILEETPDAAQFIELVKSGKGVFILSSHCGTVETLVALGACRATFHAWMDVERTSVFNAFYLRHAKRPRVVIHPITEIGLETAFFAGDAIERGDSLVMAGDRGSGAFRFAHALGAPTYFVSCVATGPVSYKAIIRRLPEAVKDMEKAYVAALAEVTAAYPEQWFEWEQTKED